MTDEFEEQEITTPQAVARAKRVREEADRRKNTEVTKQWVEIVKRVPSEDGKILLKRMTNNGYCHSWYVGRESKCQEYLLQAEKEGLYKPEKKKR